MYFVYELVDPRTDITGYIGITNNPNHRYREHLEGKVGKGKKYEWILHLQEEQTQPKMKILEIVDDLEQARIQERHWIQHYLRKGTQLVNIRLIKTPKTYMGKTAKAPSGFYTAKDVMEKLGVANSTLYHYVETGKIKKVIPPGRKEGYYPKAEIDKMVRAKELFILQYATDASLFDKAEEADIEKITELGIEVFGKHGSPNYETRLAQFHANPDIFYVLRQDELIVGYLGLFPLKHEAIEAIMAGMEEDRFRSGIINSENIVQFKSCIAEEVFVIIVTKQNLKRSTPYAARLISGGIDVLEHMARREVIIKRLYATSRTSRGIKLAKDLEFKQIIPPNEEDNLLRFMIDLEASQSPLLKNYQRIVKRVLARKQSESIADETLKRDRQKCKSQHSDGGSYTIRRCAEITSQTGSVSMASVRVT